MKYMMVNISSGNIPVDLYTPGITHKNKSLHRVAPAVAISLKRGESVDILRYFGGSLEKAHAAIKHSGDVLKLLRPNQLSIYVCDDNNNRLDPEKLLSGVKPDKPAEVKPVETKPIVKDVDITHPDMETSAVLAAQDAFEAKKSGELNDHKDDTIETGILTPQGTVVKGGEIVGEHVVGGTEKDYSEPEPSESSDKSKSKKSKKHGKK
jgi:hypothetical protein